MNFARIGHSICAVNYQNERQVYVLGGVGQDMETILDSVERYSVKDSKWESNLSLLPKPCYGTTAISVED